MSEGEKVLSVKERLALLNNKSSDSNNSTPKKEENKTVIGSTIKDRISALQSPATTSIPVAATPPSSFISSNTESSSRSSISEKIAQLQSSPSHIPSPIVAANPPESIGRNSISEKIAQLQSSSSAISSSPATPSSSESTGRSSISEKIAQLQSSTLLQSPPASAPSSSESTGRSSISEKIAQLQSSSTPNNNTISGTAITNQDDSTNIPNIESISIKDRVANLHSSTLTSADDTNNTGHKIPDRRKSAKISELGANINISFLMGKPLPRSSIIGSPTMIMDINDDNATIEKVTAVDSTGGIVHPNLTRATRSKKPSSNSKKFVALTDDD